ncbi:MAG: hypothetical protein LBR73_04240 [Oscillospiraceae bacterium]|jgi:carboxyl-terminal processing protease|nr:hypothetical protein [Oscillospiraceae bacterium]
MNRKITIGAALALALLLVAVTIPLTMMYAQNQHNKIINDFIGRANQNAVLSEVAGLVGSNYKNKLETDDINEALVRGYMSGLKDTYSKYMNTTEYNAYLEQMKGSATNLGLQVAYDKDANLSAGGIVVTGVDTRSPAARSGIAAGDLLTSVEAEGRTLLTAQNLTPESAEAAATAILQLNTIKTDNPITSVRVTFERDSVTKTVNIPLGNSVQTVTASVTDSKVAIIKISAFYANTRSQLEEAYMNVITQGAEAFLFDLRGTQEGLLEYAAETLDYLVPVGSGSKPMYSITDNKGEVKNRAADKDFKSVNPAVILVNGSTNGPAELFAYNLRAYFPGYVKVIGYQTAGNDSAQVIKKLSRVGGAIQITYGVVTPYGGGTYGRVSSTVHGVQPDYTINKQLSANLTNDAIITESLAAAVLASYPAQYS